MNIYSKKLTRTIKSKKKMIIIPCSLINKSKPSMIPKSRSCSNQNYQSLTKFKINSKFINKLYKNYNLYIITNNQSIIIFMYDLIEGDSELLSFVKNINSIELGSKINQPLKEPNGLSSSNTPNNPNHHPTYSSKHPSASNPTPSLCNLLCNSTIEETLLTLTNLNMDCKLACNYHTMHAYWDGNHDILLPDLGDKEGGKDWGVGKAKEGIMRDYESEIHDSFFRKRKRKNEVKPVEYDQFYSLKLWHSKKRCCNSQCRGDKKSAVKKITHNVANGESKSLYFCLACYPQYKKLWYCCECMQVYFTEDLGLEWVQCTQCKRSTHKHCLNRSKHKHDMSNFKNYTCIHCKEKYGYAVAGRNGDVSHSHSLGHSHGGGSYSRGGKGLSLGLAYGEDVVSGDKVDGGGKYGSGNMVNGVNIVSNGSVSGLVKGVNGYSNAADLTQSFGLEGTLSSVNHLSMRQNGTLNMNNTNNRNQNFTRLLDKNHAKSTYPQIDYSYHIPFYYGMKFTRDNYPRYYQVFDSMNWEEKVKISDANLSNDINAMVSNLIAKDANGVHTNVLLQNEKYEIVKKEIKMKSDVGEGDVNEYKIINSIVKESQGFDYGKLYPYRLKKNE
eukprot:Mrub_01923.p1 GENE.Mrub_01923~~Mrub_01923.p1  ORF type:complete len:612 (+),score=88.81 Mrub_01923:2-1837(+)